MKRMQKNPAAAPKAEAVPEPSTALAIRDSSAAADAALKPPKRIGRPPAPFKTDIAERICVELAKGRSLREICRTEDWAPSASTVLDWKRDNEAFADRYARARQDQAEMLAAEIIELADKCRMGKKVIEKPDGRKEVVVGDMVERTKLQIDARKWYASKLAPRVFGDRVEHTGSDGGPMQVMVAAWMMPQGKPDPESE